MFVALDPQSKVQHADSVPERFTRLSCAFSRSLPNLKAAVALAVVAYNFVKVNRSIRCTPAMEPAITDRLWTVPELLC